MGLINEVQGVKATLNRKEQAKAQRELKKRIEQDYNIEIKGNLQSIFYKLFETLPTKEAYKKAILEKEKNIDNITALIENIKLKNGNFKYYGLFDIVGDLQSNYFLILDKIKREYQRIETIKEQEEADRQAELLKQLENDIYNFFKKSELKHITKRILAQNESMLILIEDIAKSEKDVDILKNNYTKILNKVTKLFDGDIQTEKEDIRERKEEARQKAQAAKVARRDRLLCLHIINRWLK